ncbi:MAG: ribbon-helix-helix protein, CopG family [Actinomycetales bacterium]|nr:ribbon-helix-helix protein, CopG family [Actinomycetales bacterium]
MSTQVSLRLNDELVARIDELVRSGAVRSRAEIVESALERELRRRLYERDAEIYRTSESDPDLDALNAWMQSRRDFPGLR